MNVVLGIALIAVITVAVVFMINGVGVFDASRRPSIQDDPEIITGLIAQVTTSITAAGLGSVTYTIQGVRHDVTAKSVDGGPIGPGADVVIERIEGGTAFVERWEVVEGRI